MDPLEMRAQNVVRPETFPYRTPMGQVIDSTSVYDVPAQVGRSDRLGRNAGPPRRRTRESVWRSR